MTAVHDRKTMQDEDMSEILFSLLATPKNEDVILLGIFSDKTHAIRAQKLYCIKHKDCPTIIESIVIETCKSEEKDTSDRVFVVFKHDTNKLFRPEWFFFNCNQAKFAQNSARGKCDTLKLNVLRYTNCLADTFDEVYHYFTHLRTRLRHAQAKFCKRVTDNQGWSGHYWIGRIIRLVENQPIRSVSTCKTNEDYLALCAKAVENSNKIEMTQAWEACDL